MHTCTSHSYQDIQNILVSLHVIVLHKKRTKRTYMQLTSIFMEKTKTGQTLNPKKLIFKNKLYF